MEAESAAPLAALGQVPFCGGINTRETKANGAKYPRGEGIVMVYHLLMVEQV
jgi:hypothetical protein